MITQNFEEFAGQIDPIELTDKIREFRKLNLKDMTDEEVSQAISHVLMHNNYFVYISNEGIYPKGTKFFRVRELDGSKIPNNNLRVESDFWNAPKQCITKYGRLNKPYESLLYTSPINPMVAVNEVKLTEDTFFAVITYEAKEDIKVNCIGGEYNYEKMGITDKHVKLINNIINDFLREEFTRDVGEGTEYLYRVSEMIAKWYFDLPPRDVQDAWAYASVKNRQAYNVCFRPEVAKDVLELKGAMICKKEGESEGLNVKCIAHGFDENGIAKFYHLGSDEQRTIFPEIVIE